MSSFQTKSQNYQPAPTGSNSAKQPDSDYKTTKAPKSPKSQRGEKRSSKNNVVFSADSEDESSNTTRGRQKYSNLVDYIDYVDSDLGNAIKSCCVEFLFNPRGKPGITFLMPSYEKNTEFRKNLLYLSDGDMDERSKATDIFASLVIYENLKTIDDFKGRQEITNGANQLITLDLTNPSNSRVKLASGAYIELDKEFRELSKKNNLNVFSLCNGGISAESNSLNGSKTAGYTTQKSQSSQTSQSSQRSNRRKKQKEQAVEDETEILARNKLEYTQQMRLKIMQETENAFIQDFVTSPNMRQLSKSWSAASREQQFFKNVFLEKTISIVHFIFKYCSKETIHDVFEQRILPILSFENIDFYLIFEPMVKTANYVLPHELLERWYKSQTDFDGAATIKTIEKYLDGMNKPTTTKPPALPAFIANFHALSETVDEIRGKTNENIENQKRRSSEFIIEEYKKLSLNNAIGGVNSVFSSEIAKIYKADPTCKILQDELRYVSHKAFVGLENSSSIGDCQNVFGLIHEYLRGFSTTPVQLSAVKGDYSQFTGLKLLNANALRYNIDPTYKVMDILTFVNSVYFLYTPLSSEKIKYLMDVFEVSTAPTPSSDKIWLINMVNYATLYFKAVQSPHETSAKLHMTTRLLKELKNTGVPIEQEIIDKMKKIRKE